MRLQSVLRLSLVAGLVAFAPSARADSASALNSQMQGLKDQVRALEEKIAAMDKPAAAPAATESSPLTALTSGIQVSGFVDSTFTHNFNSPDSKNNVGRVFDNDSNDFNLNAFEVVIQKPVSAESPVGFRADIYAGEDAKLIHSAGLGSSDDSFDLQQGYAEFNLGLSKVSGLNDLDLKVGKFVTLAGAEVIEAKDNWNISRSFGFGYAVPFAHTGVRSTYVFDNGWDMILGVSNGWDNVDDSNSGKTFEAHLGLNSLKLPADSSLTLLFNGYVGPELADNNSSQRWLGDFVATYKTPWKPLTLMYNFDYAKQEDALGSGSDAAWYAHAAYFRYDIDADWSVSGRGEYFKDEDGYRIVSGTPANYREFTATLEYRPWSGVIARLEYRNDHANHAVFDDDSGTSKSQDTLAGEVIVAF